MSEQITFVLKCLGTSFHAQHNAYDYASCIGYYCCVCSCSMVDLAGAEVVDLDSHRTEKLCHIFYIVCNINDVINY